MNKKFSQINIMKIIQTIFLFFIIFVFSGCFTYYPSRETPDSVKTENDKYIKFLKFNLYDGNSIDVSETDVKYFKKYKDNNDVFVFMLSDTIYKSVNPDSIKISKVEKIIPSNQIKSVTVERRKTDAKSTLYTILIIGGVLIALTAIIIASMPEDLHVKM